MLRYVLGERQWMWRASYTSVSSHWSSEFSISQRLNSFKFTITVVADGLELGVHNPAVSSAGRQSSPVRPARCNSVTYQRSRTPQARLHSPVYTRASDVCSLAAASESSQCYFTPDRSSVSPPFHSGAAPYLSRFTLIGSQDLAVKSRPNLFIHSLTTHCGSEHIAEAAVQKAVFHSEVAKVSRRREVMKTDGTVSKHHSFIRTAELRSQVLVFPYLTELTTEQAGPDDEVRAAVIAVYSAYGISAGIVHSRHIAQIGWQARWDSTHVSLAARQLLPIPSHFPPPDAKPLSHHVLTSLSFLVLSSCASRIASHGTNEYRNQNAEGWRGFIPTPTPFLLSPSTLHRYVGHSTPLLPHITILYLKQEKKMGLAVLGTRPFVLREYVYVDALGRLDVYFTFPAPLHSIIWGFMGITGDCFLRCSFQPLHLMKRRTYALSDRTTHLLLVNPGAAACLTQECSWLPVLPAAITRLRNSVRPTWNVRKPSNIPAPPLIRWIWQEHVKQLRSLRSCQVNAQNSQPYNDTCGTPLPARHIGPFTVTYNFSEALLRFYFQDIHPPHANKENPTIAHHSGAGMKRRGRQDIPEKTLSGTIPACENPVTRPGIEPGSPWWEREPVKVAAESQVSSPGVTKVRSTGRGGGVSPLRMRFTPPPRSGVATRRAPGRPASSAACERGSRARTPLRVAMRDVLQCGLSGRDPELL
ncbi:hypothetical protein PR048_004270 [Dryococelus australis]|uniref:Uncharacterized protein n=1 Tax=Dryococelus australis TaxID=614101 RepID=A0ABQ9I500_9NEOP|nr:hypothetical protein PR048_004270 [Dryococelus australis]